MIRSMSRDPLGLDPIAAIQDAINPGSARAVQAIKAGIVTRDVTMVGAAPDPNDPLEVRLAQVAAMPKPQVLSDTGEPLTYEERCRIAAERRMPDADGGHFHQDLTDRPVEKIGASGQKIIESKPLYTLHTTTEARIVEGTP